MPTLAQFSHLELIIICGAAESLTNEDIGAQIGVSQSQIKYHLHNLFLRLGVRNREHLCRYLYSCQ